MRQILLLAIASVLCYTPSWAAIAYVTSPTPGSTEVEATTIATSAWSLGAQRLVVVCVRWGNDGTPNATVSTVADTAGNTYADSGAGRRAISGSTVGFLQMFYAYNSTANASNVITVTFSETVDRRSVMAAEYSGVKTSADPNDVGAIGSASNATSVTSGSFTPSEANEVAVACVGTDSTGGTLSAGSNYTERTSATLPTNEVGLIEDRLSAPVAGQTASASAGNNKWWEIIVRTFEEAPGGGYLRRRFQ